MKVHNIRYGFATNSSSTHSIVILPKGDYHDNYEGGHFGWEHFTLVSREAKLKYLAAMLEGNFESDYHLSKEEASMAKASRNAIIEAWTGVAPGRDGFEGIDHQSHYTIPSSIYSKIPDRRFFEAVRAQVLREDVAILGGNDNDDTGHPLSGMGTDLGLPRVRDYSTTGRLSCRWDGDFCTVFNLDTGKRTTVSFGEEEAPTKLQTPLLVDVSITDKCESNCSFCYRSSTPDGAHADTYEIHGVADALEQLKVFEVAIGGGEPTKHPDFIKILEEFRFRGIIPNFTTKSREWLKDPGYARQVGKLIGSFGFSISDGWTTDYKDVIAAYTYLRDSLGFKPPTLHLVMGTMYQSHFEDVLRSASVFGIPVLLLGFKSVGRGLKTKVQPYDWWLESAKKLMDSNMCPQIAIDTAMAKKFQKKMSAFGINRKLYHTEEGKVSMFVDAVRGTISPSSYEEKNVVKVEGDKYIFEENKWYNAIAKHFPQW